MSVELMITVIFCLFTIVLPIILWKKFSSNEHINIVATLGILGTFGGIFWGLLNFGVDNITSSIPQLLDGLRTAFVTSIVGMLVGLVIKFINSYNRKKESEESDPALKIVELLDAIKKNTSEKGNDNEILKEISLKTDTYSTAILKAIDKIEKSVAGDGEATLLTQIQKLRMTFSDKQEDLIKEFRGFSQIVAENSTKAITEALTNVIRDFNQKITEQFGDNFKELNFAVKNMLEWQDNYKLHIDNLENSFNHILKSMDSTKTVFTEIVKRTEVFASTAEKLDLTVTSVQQNNRMLAANLEQFKNLGEKAALAFPDVVKNVNTLTNEFSKAVMDNIKRNHEIYESVNKAILEQSKSIQVEQEKFALSLETMIQKTNDNIVNQFTQLDKNLGDELQKSLNSLGSHLLSLSNRFVQDYTPLTNSLKELVQMLNNGWRK